jgi:hypothetical protein
VLDRGSGLDRAALTIFSGESAFRTPVFQSKLPWRGLGAPMWGVELGRDNGSVPALLFLKRVPTGAAHLEVHPALGQNGFRSFVGEQMLGIRAPLPARTRVVFGELTGAPSLIVIDPPRGAAGRVRIVPFLAAPPVL